jgi:hypothetical protein
MTLLLAMVLDEELLIGFVLTIWNVGVYLVLPAC